jgi:hypothetical protein
MSVFHSPRCRITSTDMWAGGVWRDVAAPDDPLHLYINGWVDPGLRTDPGYFIIYWRIHTASDRAEVHKETWIGLNKNFPQVGNFFVLWGKSRADAWTGGYGWGPYLFQAEFYFRLGGRARDEFAFSEEPHYFLVSQS